MELELNGRNWKFSNCSYRTEERKETIEELKEKADNIKEDIDKIKQMKFSKPVEQSCIYELNKKLIEIKNKMHKLINEM